MHSHMYTSQLQQQQEKLLSYVIKYRSIREKEANEKKNRNYNKHIKHTKKKRHNVMKHIKCNKYTHIITI